MLGQLDNDMQKNEVEDISDTIYKNQLKMEHRSTRAKTIKLTEENIGVNLHVLVLGNVFLEMLSRKQATKKKINCTSSKLKAFVLQRL